jgi:hypothetical protein
MADLAAAGGTDDVIVRRPQLCDRPLATCLAELLFQSEDYDVDRGDERKRKGKGKVNGKSRGKGGKGDKGKCGKGRGSGGDSEPRAQALAARTADVPTPGATASGVVGADGRTPLVAELPPEAKMTNGSSDPQRVGR